jgi:serine-type D-Ala-D-Ala carboxypeptidase/endopeptidase (penicillin-binding protein 4)
MFTMYISPKKHPIIKPCNQKSNSGSFRITVLTLVLLLTCSFSLSSPLQAVTSPQLRLRFSDISPLGSVLLNDEAGKPLITLNPDQQLIPASLIKIVTALAAIELLGTEFRFQTEFYTDQKGNLAIKGWGDPFLISEEIQVITRSLKKMGLASIRQIQMDTSAFSSDIEIPGTGSSLNPYDALNGSLVVNFNTLYLGKTRGGVVYSAEDHTPLTPLALQKGKLIKNGTKERINLAESRSESLDYVGQLFSAFLAQSNISIQKKDIGKKSIERDWNLLLRHRNTRDLPFILKGLMKYSNNFIANQIFLVMGAEKLGYPASMTKSRAVLKDYLKHKWHFDMLKTVFYEASGISRKNQMSARQLMDVLESFRPYFELLPSKNGVRIKSGTLTGVYNYAGYLETENGLRPFVIITNQEGNHRDSILALLRKLSDSLKIETYQAVFKETQKERKLLL